MVTGPRIFIIHLVHDSVALRLEGGQLGDQPGNARIRAAQYTLLITGKPVFACQFQKIIDKFSWPLNAGAVRVGGLRTPREVG